MEITEQIVDDKVMKYTYILGHGFSAADHKAVMLGRFGTTEEAKHHIENINQESQEDGGCIGFKDEFPFLILEILTIEFEKGKENEGIPYKFYRFDWEKSHYVESDSKDKSVVLEEYKVKATAFMETLKELEEE